MRGVKLYAIAICRILNVVEVQPGRLATKGRPKLTSGLWLRSETDYAAAVFFQKRHANREAKQQNWEALHDGRPFRFEVREVWAEEMK